VAKGARAQQKLREMSQFRKPWWGEGNRKKISKENGADARTFDGGMTSKEKKRQKKL